MFPLPFQLPLDPSHFVSLIIRCGSIVTAIEGEIDSLIYTENAPSVTNGFTHHCHVIWASFLARISHSIGFHSIWVYFIVFEFLLLNLSVFHWIWVHIIQFELFHCISFTFSVFHSIWVLFIYFVSISLYLSVLYWFWVYFIVIDCILLTLIVFH